VVKTANRPGKNGFIDVYRAIVSKRDTREFTDEPVAGNLLVTAHDLGLASCPVTFHDQDCARQVLGLPDDHEAPMGVGVGHPAPPGDQKESAARIPLDELVHWGRWRA